MGTETPDTGKQSTLWKHGRQGELWRRGCQGALWRHGCQGVLWRSWFSWGTRGSAESRGHSGNTESRGCSGGVLGVLGGDSLILRWGEQNAVERLILTECNDFSLEQSRNESLKNAFEQVCSIDGLPRQSARPPSYPYFAILKDRLYGVTQDAQTKQDTTQLLVPKSCR